MIKVFEITCKFPRNDTEKSSESVYQAMRLEILALYSMLQHLFYISSYFCFAYSGFYIEFLLFLVVMQIY